MGVFGQIKFMIRDFMKLVAINFLEKMFRFGACLVILVFMAANNLQYKGFETGIRQNNNVRCFLVSSFLAILIGKDDDIIMLPDITLNTLENS